MSGPPFSELKGLSVVVTGGAGFIGSHLVDRLIEEEVGRITVIDSMWLGRRENLADAMARRPDLVLEVLDASRPVALRNAIRRARPDVAFALATVPLLASHERPRWSTEMILKLTTVLVDLARTGDLGRLVHCSSSEVYGSAVHVPMTEDHPLLPETPYAAAKAAADLIVRSYWETFDIDATIVRPFNTYGPRQNDRRYAGLIPVTLRRIQRGDPPIVYGDGEQTRDFTHVSDTVDGLVRAAVAPASRRMVINVASGREVSVNSLVAMLLQLSGSDLVPIRMPERIADVRRHLADITVARETIAFASRVDLAQGLGETVRWYLDGGGPCP
ncbi:MAG: GDP-mannose 4,6-dehydratase [Elusimicrobia bacterium]|nr:GDP-mannose 4,6-dehydratase [Elusimicrobiota bacterium]